ERLPERERAPIVRLGLVEASVGREQVAEVVVRVGHAGVEREGAAVARLGIVELAQLLERAPEVEMRVRVLRLQRRGALERQQRRAHARTIARANAIQAAMNAVPPAGVTAPSARGRPSASRYRLPENSAIPASIRAPDHLSSDDSGSRARASPTASRPSAW